VVLVCFPAHRPLGKQKNKPGTLIVLYDDIERLSAPAASHLFERGYDNLYVLSGGASRYHPSPHSRTHAGAPLTHWPFQVVHCTSISLGFAPTKTHMLPSALTPTPHPPPAPPTVCSIQACKPWDWPFHSWYGGGSESWEGVVAWALGGRGTTVSSPHTHTTTTTTTTTLTYMYSHVHPMPHCYHTPMNGVVCVAGG
jgi:hypothetical protein